MALILWWNTRPGLVHDLALATFLVTSISTILFNLNPLLRLDGYYMASDWLEIPNLRRRADQMLAGTFARWCLGIRTPASTGDDASTPARGAYLFIAYSLAAFVYRWFVCFAICLILYQLVRPVGLEHLGLLAGIASAVAAVGTALWRMGRHLSENWEQMASYARPAATLGVLAILLLAALFVPLPVHVDASLILQPRNVQHVYVTTPGRIEAVHVRPGQRVKRGDRLARLANFRQEDHLRQLKLALASQEMEIRVQNAVGDAAQAALAVESLQAMRKEAAEFEQQLARLSVVAPCDGVVVGPIKKRGHRLNGMRWKSLPTWEGSPLDLQNRGSFLEAGTHLLSIAPEERYHAVLRIDEPDRSDFAVGQDVKIKVEHLPGLAVHSKIHRLTQNASDPAQRLSIEAPVYNVHAVHRVHEASVLLPPGVPGLIPGMHGQARILVTHRSAAGWLWRFVCNTFKFLG
jgi:putative peptide zinc metalloprotease protein